ncbi:MAG: GH3 auxin-responsive promoter family protein [Oscillospiraceae bacterium]|nr:GH3 auxin-responsive promoter family protein [Oscillospiraceae bacterium]
MKARTLNRLCCRLYAPAWQRFSRRQDVGRVQRSYLKALLARNADTAFGREHGFAKLHGYEDFARAVPVRRYEDLAPYIDRIAAGEPHVLTGEPVTLLEPTSGSSGGRKLIPYTASLHREFQCGIRPWIYDLYTRVPGADAGQSYWSVTPVTQGRQYTACGIPIGFEEDTAYFGRLEQHIMRRLFAVDGNVKFAGSMEAFYWQTAKQLLTCPALTLISVWNPTYLTILCDFIRTHARALTRDLPAPRALSVRRAAAENRFDRVFPALRVISAWADGSAAPDAKALQGYFPGVLFQPKGLLATECFVSLPLIGETGSRLSLHSHFFEFRDAKAGRICTADALTPGRYEIIVTTGGGLYRYAIGDMVEILEVFPDAPPRLRFLGRSGITSDLCGEKLTEEFVQSVLISLGCPDALLAPKGKQYLLFTQTPVTADALDRALCESYHYAYCRRLGQLRQAAVIRVTESPRQVYLRRRVREGMRLGDIKSAHLCADEGWQQEFQGRDVFSPC